MCTFDTDRIYLTWKKGVDEKRHIIGMLKKENDNYSFLYLQENLDTAKKDGFLNYPAFDDVNKKYTENVLEVFSRRLINPTRPDYDKFLSYWCAMEYKGNIFALLGLTGAKLLTDNFEFIAPHAEVPAVFYTNMSWLSKSTDVVREEVRASDLYEVNKHLSLQIDENNDYDTNAVEILYKQQKLGYLKSIHCENVAAALRAGKSVSVGVKNIIRNGTIKEILLRINIS